jgi:iron complex transport system ATP-binding protein
MVSSEYGLLRVDSVCFGYGSARRPFGRLAGEAGDRLVLNEVSLTIDPGLIVGLLGPNGSGKTTLIRILAGLLTPLRGSVMLDGQPLAAWSRRQLARRMALVPQETNAAFDFSVLDMVLMGRYPHIGTFALEGPQDLALAREALAATGTSPFEGRAFKTLSGGEKQRVVIASALAQASDVLLLDEPTASLDLGYQLEVAALLRRLNRDRGVTMVLATHDLNLAASLCDRLILMRDGRVVAQGATRDVLTAASIRRIYDVDADVSFHGAAGHVTVTPLRRVQ